jgi:hypothetical protein
MSWTVACFCGNVYTAPPDRCEVCGCSVDSGISVGAATSHHQPAELHRHAAHSGPHGRPGWTRLTAAARESALLAVPMFNHPTKE